MARQDLRKQITIYPPDGKPGEKHSLLNARDLITHKNWSTTPQSADQFTAVAEILSKAVVEPTEDEVYRQKLIATPVDKMTLAQIHEYAEVAFGTKIDKRLNLTKALDRLNEIADASNFKLLFSDAVKDEDEDEEKDDASEDEKEEDASDEDESGDKDEDESNKE